MSQNVNRLDRASIPWQAGGGLLLLMALLVAQGRVFGWEPVDDAYISFRYARNLAEGHGLVFNPDQRVEGYTNFLWTVLLAGAARLRLDIPRAATWLGAAFACASLGLVWLLARRVARERGWPIALAWAPPLLLACYPGWSYWAFSGMEGPLLAALVLGLLLVGCGPRPTAGTALAAGVIGSLAAMTRWETVLLWPVPVIACLCDGSRAPLRRLGLAALLSAVLLAGFGIYFAWRFSYYGELMPNTYYAKVGGALPLRLARGAAYTGELVVGWLLPLTVISWMLGPLRRWTITLAATLLIYAGYVTWTGGDFFPWLRFYLPVIPIAAVLAVDLVHRVAVSRSACAPSGRLLTLLTLAMAATTAGIALRIDLPTARDHARWVAGWKKIGTWAKTAFPPHDRLALAPVGALAYTSEHPVIDVLGLTDHEVAHGGQTDPAEPPGHQRSHIESVLRRKPEVVLGQGLVFESPPTEEQAIARSLRSALKRMYASPRFRELYRFEVARVGDVYVPYWILREAQESGDAPADPGPQG